MRSGGARFRLLVSGLLLGLTGLLLFGSIHAIVIVPIWSRVIRGLPVAVAVSLAVTWAFHETRRRASAPPGIGAGLRFGALMWVAGVPAMVLAFGTRLMQTSGPIHWWIDVATVVVAALGGAALLWRLTRTRRGAIAGGIALGLLLPPNGGPMPIESLRRGVGLPAGFFVIAALSGAVLALLYARFVFPLTPKEPPSGGAAGEP